MRYVLVPGPLQPGHVELPKHEADHLRTVLRGAVGDRIGILNGAGGRAEADLQVVERKRVIADIGVVEHHQPSPASRVHIATAPPKGGRWEDLLRGLTELGVGTIQPLQWQRSVRMPNRDDRAQRTVAEALKQCRRVWLPQILPATTPLELLRSLDAGAQVFLADPAGASLLDVPLQCGPQQSGPQQSGPLVVLVGPEGGVADDERDAVVAAGAQLVRVAPHVLRIETAAMAMAACLVARTC